MPGLGHTKTSLELAASCARVNILWCRNHDLLLLIIIGGALTLVLGFLDGRLLVALVQVEDDVGIEVLNLLLQVGNALDPTHI